MSLGFKVNLLPAQQVLSPNPQISKMLNEIVFDCILTDIFSFLMVMVTVSVK